VDPDYTYTDPATGLLRNKEGIDNDQLLTVFESMKCSERLEELSKTPIRIKDSASLLAMHKYLFQDVYDWAGKKRTVEISKQGKPFFLTKYFDSGFAYIDNLIIEYRKIDSADKRQLAVHLANLLDSINYLHPFREGNGRTQREFLRILALEKEYTLNLNPPDNTDVYERYMSGTIEGDVDKLTELIEELLEKGDGKETKNDKT
jgi:cell filamentation protein